MPKAFTFTPVSSSPHGASQDHAYPPSMRTECARLSVRDKPARSE